jgi:hypothetical protein
MVIGIQKRESFLSLDKAVNTNWHGASPYESAATRLLAQRGLNPQPLPPVSSDVLRARILNSLEARGLNPQPLPPKAVAMDQAWLNPLVSRGLNPQPLPPKTLSQIPTNILLSYSMFR